MSVVTRERLEQAIRTMAQVVAKYGDVYLPIFNRLYAELEIMNEAEKQKARARQIALKLAEEDIKIASEKNS